MCGAIALALAFKGFASLAVQSLSLAHGAVGVLSAHDGLHHLCHTAGLPMCGAIGLVLAFGGFAFPAMQSPSLAHGAVGVRRDTMACITSVTPLVYSCVAPSLWLLHSKALHLLPCSHSAWLMAPSECSVHTMACITSVTPLANPRVAPLLWFLHSMASHLLPCSHSLGSWLRRVLCSRRRQLVLATLLAYFEQESARWRWPSTFCHVLACVPACVCTCSRSCLTYLCQHARLKNRR